MFSWPILVIALLVVLWWAALTFGDVLMDDDERAMRDYEAERDAFERYFE